MALAQRCAAAARTLACAAPSQYCAAPVLGACTQTSAAPSVLLPSLLLPSASFCSSATLREFPGADQLRCTVSAAAPVLLLPAQLQAHARFCSGAAVREVPAEGAGQLSFAARPTQAGQQAVYMVDIITGDVRGAGTEVRLLLLRCLNLELCAWCFLCATSLCNQPVLPACVTKKVACLVVQAPAVIRLIGSEGQSEEYVLGARPVFCQDWPAPLSLFRCCAPAVLDHSFIFKLRHTLLQATTRTSMASSAARGGGMRWTWAGAWAPCAAYLCSRCAAQAARRNV